MFVFCSRSECQTSAGCRCNERTPRLPSGWQCPNCGRAHAPDVKTCPIDNRPLRARMQVFNG